MNQQQLTDLRNELYYMLPTGEVHAFDLTTAIKHMFARFDEFIDNNADPKMALPQTTEDRIKADALTAYPCTVAIHNKHMENVERYRIGYIAGATAENERAQGLVHALEKIRTWHSPGHSAAWAIVNIKNIAIEVLIKWNDGKGKEDKQ